MNDMIDGVETVRLEAFRFGIMTRISKELLGAEVEFADGGYPDWFASDIAVRVRGFVWGEDAQSYTFRAPLNWWEALKERAYQIRFWRHLNLEKRWPVRYRVEKLTPKILYPELRISLPDKSPVINLAKIDRWTEPFDPSTEDYQ